MKKYLRISTTPSEEKENLLSSTTTSTRFERMGRPDLDYRGFTNYMHVDGFLIFQIIANNTDELAAGQIIEHLYRNYEPRTRNHMSNV
jgi:hypothetical protein